MWSHTLKSEYKIQTGNSGTNSNSFNNNNFKKEEEEHVTLDKVTEILNQQINKREITNTKTLTAIL